MGSEIRRTREEVVQEKYFSSHRLLGFLFVLGFCLFIFFCFVFHLVEEKEKQEEEREQKKDGEGKGWRN